MARLLLCILLIFALFNKISPKKSKYLPIESCESENVIIAIEKCQVEDNSMTVIVNIKYPIVKAIVSGQADYLDSSNKTVQSLKYKDIDWCEIFKKGKVFVNPLWKILMTAYGKVLKPLMKCPIKNRVELNRISGDIKSLQVLPSTIYRFVTIINVTAENGQKDFFTIKNLFQVYE